MPEQKSSKELENTNTLGPVSPMDPLMHPINLMDPMVLIDAMNAMNPIMISMDS